MNPTSAAMDLARSELLERQERLLAQAERIDDLRLAITKLLRVFPTDTDMQEAGWTSKEIEVACNAYDYARSALNKEKPL